MLSKNTARIGGAKAMPLAANRRRLCCFWLLDVRSGRLVGAFVVKDRANQKRFPFSF
jgi:hypothetical protein